MKNKYLITGATGFVGSNIIRKLVDQGENVNVIVRNKKNNWRIKDLEPNINIFESDILSPSIVKIVKKINPDYIFHLAAYGVLPTENNIERMVDINIKGTINLLEAVKRTSFKLFINTGSAVEYGIKTKKMAENDFLEPINDYGITKAASTLYCKKEGIRNNLPIITFRLFTPFGQYEDKNRLIPSVILNCLDKKPINVSTSSSVRDFIHVDDVVNAYLNVENVNPGEIFNIGSGNQHSIGEVVDLVQKITKSNSKVSWGSVKQQARFIEPKIWEADISKARKILRWKQKNSFNRRIEETVDWFKNNKNLYE